MNCIKTILAFLLGLVLMPAARAGTPPGVPLDPSVTHEVMIRLGDPFTIEQFLPQVIAHNPAYGVVQIIESIESRKTYLLGFPGLDEQTVGLDLGATFVTPPPALPTAQKPLKWAEANYKGRAAEGKTGGLFVSQLGVGPTQYAGQYASDLLGLTSAHAASTGVGTVVAVLDTGVDPSHPALGGDVLPFGFNFITETSFTGDVATGTDSDGDGDPDELVGHGTFVAGLVHLVAPDAKILPVTVLDSEGIGDAFDIGEGMYFAIDGGAHVINMSLGSTYKSEIFEDAIDEAALRGIVVTGSAGNFNVDEPEEFPALVSDAVGVAALNHADIKALFSNYNNDLVISAPGDSIQLPSGVWDVTRSVISPVPGGGYAIWEGTSFSAAQVSGVVALVRSQLIALSDSIGTYDQLMSILAGTALNVDALNPAYKEMLGAGRVRAGAATAASSPAPTIGDLNYNGVVNGLDLAQLLSQWSGASTYQPCLPLVPEDLNTDCKVNGIDLAILLGNWG